MSVWIVRIETSKAKLRPNPRLKLVGFEWLYNYLHIDLEEVHFVRRAVSWNSPASLRFRGCLRNAPKIYVSAVYKAPSAISFFAWPYIFRP